MSKYNNETTQRTIGLDLGDRYSYYLVLGPGGEILQEGRVKTQTGALEQVFSDWIPARVALEVGTHSPWVSRLLQGLGHQVIVANARKVRLIYARGVKDDRLDAETLARLARTDVQLLAPIQHRAEEIQKDLAVVRSRAQLVQARTALINHVRMSVKAIGQRLPSSSTPAFARRVGPLLAQDFPSLVPILEIIQHLTSQIHSYDKRILKLCQDHYPETEVLRQIPGVGPLSALTFVLTLEQPSRFARSRQVGAFLGLCPRRSQSGDRNPQLRITKAGDRLLRRLLVHCAHYILGPFAPDSDLRRHGEKIAARGGANAKKRAVVAVARKLSVVMHHLWKHQKTYQPLYQTGRKAA